MGRILPWRAKVWLKHLRHKYVRWAFRFTTDDLLQALRSVGLRSGDVVVVHSSYDRFEGFSGSPGDVIAVLKKSVGPNGTILMPTMPFTGTAVEYAQTQPEFDVRKTPSRMGLITEVFRRLPDVMRSIHPTHPVAAWGLKSTEVLADHNLARSPFGPDTPWGRLPAYDGKILFLGASATAMTFFHAVEESLEFVSSFAIFEEEEFVLRCGDAEGSIRECRTRLPSVGLAARRDLSPLLTELKERNCWSAAKVGGVRIILLQATDILASARALARKGVFCVRG